MGTPSQAGVAMELSMDCCAKLAAMISDKVVEDLHRRLGTALLPCKPRDIAQVSEEARKRTMPMASEKKPVHYDTSSEDDEDANLFSSLGVVPCSQPSCAVRGEKSEQIDSCLAGEKDVPASSKERPTKQSGRESESTASEGFSENSRPKCKPPEQHGLRNAQPSFMGSNGLEQNSIKNPRQMQLNELEARLSSSLFDSRKSNSSAHSGKGSRPSGQHKNAGRLNNQRFLSFSKNKPTEPTNQDAESDPALRALLVNVEKHAKGNGVPRSAGSSSRETSETQDGQAQCGKRRHHDRQLIVEEEKGSMTFSQHSDPAGRYRDGRKSCRTRSIHLPGQAVRSPGSGECSPVDSQNLPLRRDASYASSRTVVKPSLSNVRGSRKLSQVAVESLRNLHSEQLMHIAEKKPDESRTNISLEEDQAGCISQAFRRTSQATLGWILYASGIMPLDRMDNDATSKDARRLQWRWWASHVYQGFIILLLALITASSMFFSATASDRDSFSSRATLLSNTSMTLSAFIGQVSLAVLGGCRSLPSLHDVLTNHLRRRACLSKWIWLSFKDAVLVFGVWLSALVSEVYFSWFEMDAAYRIVAFTISSSALVCITITLLYMCRGLACAVDAYSSEFFVRRPCFRRAVREWNFLQAMLRKSCGAIEICLFSLQSTVTAVVLLCLADLVMTLASGADVAPSNVLRFLPTFLLGMGVIRITMLGAQVTEKCQRVPGFVNSLSFGLDIDHERTYVVDYVTSSAAGFYIFEVRLTSAMTFKIIYLGCVLLMGTVTKIFFSG